jgi:hypothetical protein
MPLTAHPGVEGDPILQLVLALCLDALKPRWSVVAIHIDTSREADMPALPEDRPLV